MKKIFSHLTSFLSYHNAVPIAVSVLFVGGASAFAANATGVLPPPSELVRAVLPEAPQEVDVSTLISADLGAFDFRPTVTGVTETDASYTVSYSLQTLAPQDGAWVAFEKTGEFSVAKDTLDDMGLQGYVVQKLRDIENSERSYLARAQEAEKKLADAHTAKPTNAFAALVGLALDQIPVPVVEKPVPEPQAQVTPPAQPIPTPAETGASAPTPSPVATSTPTATSTPAVPETTSVTTTATTTTPVATSTESSGTAATDTASTTTTTTDTASTTPPTTESPDATAPSPESVDSTSSPQANESTTTPKLRHPTQPPRQPTNPSSNY